MQPDFDNLRIRVVSLHSIAPYARPMHPDWVRSIKEQCKEAKVPFFFKQWGEYMTLPQGKSATGYRSHFWEDGRQAIRTGKKQAGHLLDGVEYREMPEVKNEK